MGCWTNLVGVSTRRWWADDGNRMPSLLEARRRAAGDSVAIDSAEERAEPNRGVLLKRKKMLSDKVAAKKVKKSKTYWAFSAVCIAARRLSRYRLAMTSVIPWATCSRNGTSGICNKANSVKVLQWYTFGHHAIKAL